MKYNDIDPGRPVCDSGSLDRAIIDDHAKDGGKENFYQDALLSLIESL